MHARSLIHRLAGLALAAAALAGCAAQASDRPAEAALPYATTFQHGCGHWYVDTDAYARYSCEHGGYRVRILGPRPQESRAVLPAGVGALRVQASFVSSGGVRAGIGVGCWSDQTHGYVFLLDPDRGALLLFREHEDPGAAHPRDAIAGRMRSSFGSPGENRVELRCTRLDSGSVRLEALVDGTEVGRIVDDHPSATSFRRYGIAVFGRIGADVRFTRIAADRSHAGNDQ